jgi:hypothetical protein
MSDHKVLSCPFCGGDAHLSMIGRDWYRITADHAEGCILEDIETDCPQTDEQLPLLLRDWNSRAPMRTIIQTMQDNGELIALQATVAQQAKMIEHLRGGPTPLYTAVDMANAARDGFRDGVDSFKIRGEVLMEIFHDGGTEPFVCAIHGCICLEQVEAAQKDFRENMPDELDRGEGIYTFSFYYDRGQYDGYGRCEIAAGWGFDFVSFKAFEDEEVPA